MTIALIVLGYTLFILTLGIAIGATLFLDFLAWLRARPAKHTPSKLPLARQGAKARSADVLEEAGDRCRVSIPMQDVRTAASGTATRRIAINRRPTGSGR